MFVFNTGLTKFFYTLNVVIYNSIDESRLVIAIFVRVVIDFGVRRVKFINNL